MLAEVTKLQDRLGVPKDENLDDEYYGLGGIDPNNDDTKNANVGLQDENFDGNEAVDTSTSVWFLSKLEKNFSTTNTSVKLSPKKDLAIDYDRLKLRDDYSSDDYSEENSYSENSSSECDKQSDRSTNSKLLSDDVESNSEAPPSEIEDAPEIRNRSEGYSDVVHSSSHLASDTDISEIC